MSATRTSQPTYHMRLEYFALDGTSAFEMALGPLDFARAIETAFFAGLRQGRFQEYRVPSAGVRIEPRFASRRVDSPLTEGFTVVLPADDGSDYRVDFDTDFLEAHAKRLLVDRVVGGELEADTFKYRLSAFLDEQPAARNPLGLTLEAEEPAVPLRPVRRASLGQASVWDSPTRDDFPVLIPRPVLDEAVAEAREAPEQEVGGFLLGHLCRDPDTAELFLWVTTHVPAENTEATQTSVTFTAESWARAREVIEWRGEGEIFAGWVHSHPFRFCAECPNPPKPDCPGKVLFFSSEDHFLMEVAFPQPFMVALQTAVEPRLEAVLGHLPVKLYGWRNGVVVPRGFEVLEES